MLPRNYKPSSAALRWHYNMCVIENMCASLLDAEGGAKRLPWRQGPVLIQFPDTAIDEQDIAEKQAPPEPQPLSMQPRQPNPSYAGEFSQDHRMFKRKCMSPWPDAMLNDEDEVADHEWYFVQELHRLLNREAAARKEQVVVGAWGCFEDMRSVDIGRE